MGYTNKKLMIADCTTDANFRSWGKDISDEMAAMGWVQTSDTGQVNWTTVTIPASTYVYEIWRPDDALQTGSSQFFLKIYYGYRSTNGPSVKIEIGTSTNGSGTITGTTTGVIQLHNEPNGTNQGTSQFESYFSGDTDRAAMLLWRNGTGGNNSQIAFFAVERTKDVDGTNTADGVTVFTANGNGQGVQGQETLLFSASSSMQSAERDFVALSNGNNASAVFSNNIPVSPAFPEYGRYGNPHTVIGFVHTQDVAEATFFSTTLYGVTRTYLATGVLFISWPNNAKLCMRYD